jgi:phosphoesterase RecJ-like protein
LNVEYDEELATINLLGIATDTGFFKYSNTNSKVFTDAAYLVDKGANLNKITNQILENKPIEHIKLMKDVLEEMKFEFDNKLAYSTVSLEMLNKYGIEQKDTPPFVGDLRSLRGVEVAIMYNQAEDNEYHISMRSKSWFDVSEVAVHFGGGGHKKTASFSYKTDNIEELMKKVSNFIGEKL